jgi:hypothetical protein
MAEYMRRFYLKPAHLLSLIDCPEGYSVRTIHYQPDRNAFCVYLNTPETPEFLIGDNEPIPVLPLTVITSESEDASPYIRLSLPAEVKTDATNPRRSQKANRQA